MNAPPGAAAPTEGVTVGELGRWLNRVDKQLTALTDEIREQRSEYVHRTEWDARKEETNRRLDALEHDLDDKADKETTRAAIADVARALEGLKGALEQRRPQWTAILAAVVSALSLGLVLLQTVPGH